MFGGISPSQVQGMMKKMGIAQTPLRVDRVIFERQEGNLVIEDPQVIKIMMQGQESYQVTGKAVEEKEEIFSEDDVKIVMEKTGKDEDEVKEALKKANGDIAEAIMELSQ